MRARARWTGVVMVVIATATAVIAVSRPAAAESCRIDHTVRHGDWGDAVLCVERALLERGYMTTNIDIRFGTSTVDAVRRFRGDHGLTRSGLVGPQAGRRLGIWARRAVPTHDPREVRLLGRSVRGHAIRAYRYGTGRGKPAVAIGQIHGNEPGGAMIAAFLRTRGSRRGVDLWVIDSVNPSGWRSQQRDQPAAASTSTATSPPATGGTAARARRPTAAPTPPQSRRPAPFNASCRAVRPRVMIVWHQVGRHVDDNRSVANRALLKQYASLVGFPVKSTPSCTTCGGTATAFVNRRLGGTAFSVEMPATFSTRRGAPARQRVPADRGELVSPMLGALRRGRSRPGWRSAPPCRRAGRSPNRR